jgi:hypothetical protein
VIFFGKNYFYLKKPHINPSMIFFIIFFAKNIKKIEKWQKTPKKRGPYDVSGPPLFGKKRVFWIFLGFFQFFYEFFKNLFCLMVV